MKKAIYCSIAVVMLLALALTACNAAPAAPEQSADPVATPVQTAEQTPEPAPEPAATERPAKTGTYYPGDYTGKVKGYGGYVLVTITVDDNAITNVKIVGEHETSYIGGIPIEDMPKEILEAQSSDVDVVSGATFTSQAIIDALDMALAEAKGE